VSASDLETSSGGTATTGSPSTKKIVNTSPRRAEDVSVQSLGRKQSSTTSPRRDDVNLSWRYRNYSPSMPDLEVSRSGSKSPTPADGEDLVKSTGGTWVPATTRSPRSGSVEDSSAPINNNNNPGSKSPTLLAAPDRPARRNTRSGIAFPALGQRGSDDQYLNRSGDSRVEDLKQTNSTPNSGASSDNEAPPLLRLKGSRSAMDRGSNSVIESGTASDTEGKKSPRSRGLLGAFKKDKFADAGTADE
jgi:hypothetical protein